MMTRETLVAALIHYKAHDETERDHQMRAVDLLQNTASCFLRSDFPGHIVGGGWLVSKDGTKVLLTRHKYLDRWLQFGGHADGNPDIAAAAMQETLEESGVKNIEFVSNDIFDIDAHVIPANPKKDEPEHDHYELRYLLRATDDAIIDPECEVKWFTAAELDAMTLDASCQRMNEKWQAWLKAQQ